jgi:hypothetical protein
LRAADRWRKVQSTSVLVRLEVKLVDRREHYEDVNALVASIAKALDKPHEEAAREIENGTITLTMGEDENGHRFVEARRGADTAKVYQGAIRHAPDSGPPGGQESGH